VKKVVVILLAFLTVFFSACNQQKDKSPEENPDSQVVKNEQLSEKEVADYKAKGKEIADTTFKALSGKLQAALAKGGVEETVKYCNINAYPLTDSLSALYNAEIKRAALKCRNPKNSLQGSEKKVYKMFDALLSKDETLTPIVTKEKDGVHFYAPIMAKPLCLTCHGYLDTHITAENYKIIKALYPDDRAVDFAEGDLRGIWSIKFN